MIPGDEVGGFLSGREGEKPKYHKGASDQQARQNALFFGPSGDEILKQHHDSRIDGEQRGIQLALSQLREENRQGRIDLGVYGKKQDPGQYEISQGLIPPDHRQTFGKKNVLSAALGRIPAIFEHEILKRKNRYIAYTVPV